MDLLASAGTPLLLVNLIFAAIALAVGFAAGAWVTGGKASDPQPTEPTDEPGSTSQEQVLAAERTLLASDRLRDLAASVASDVGTHNANIGAIEARLSGEQNAGQATPDAVLQALAEIGKANDALQNKLSKAEDQIQAQAQQIRTHESEARTDSLTNLPNRRAFDDELMRRVAEWQRFDTPLSLLILDVDHFKRFNDTHGHQAGDEVLRQVGKTLAECVREMDLPCRYGGEEFAIVMPATDSEGGRVLAERVRSAIESMEVEFEGKNLSVTASLGLAGILHEEDHGLFLKRADEALYVSKDAGRNNAHWHTGETSIPITPGKATPEPSEESHSEPASTLVLDGLPNRTRFLEILRAEVRVAQESAAPLTILGAEFEGYRQLLDEYGDAVARLTLDSIAQFLDNALQPDDQLGTLGEGHFVILMPRQDADQVARVGKRINTALANCSIPLGQTELPLGTTMSVTAMTESDTAVSLMQRLESNLAPSLSMA